MHGYEDLGPAAERGSAHLQVPHDLAAAVHVHSTYSDGTATVEEIVEAAADAEADAVIVTDHDTMQAKGDGHEGWHNGVLLLVGLEISPKGGHFLAFGLDRAIEHAGRSEREICEAVKAAGGLGFPAHPFSEGSRISRTIAPPHPWSELDGCSVTGIELWSLVTEAAERCRTPRELARFIRRPDRVVDHPPERNMREWDRLCRKRRVVGIGGLDAHQSGLRLPGGHVLSPMPHSRFFRMLRTHVLCDARPNGELAHDRSLVLEALREGRCFLGRDSLASTRGFRFYATGTDDAVWMGDERPAGEWTLHVRVPQPAAVVVMRDGQPLHEADNSFDLDVAEPGVYRAEARLTVDGRPRTWIVSNPIYLRA
ncbi:MAG TPA: CehA/McbA family metallohydrolase [Thermoleophilaceae bacterium]